MINKCKNILSQKFAKKGSTFGAINLINKIPEKATFVRNIN